MGIFRVEEMIKLYFEILLQPAVKMAAMKPGDPMYCMPLTMMVTDMREVCTASLVWECALGMLGTYIANEYDEGEYDFSVNTLYTTGAKVGDYDDYVPYAQELDKEVINHIHRFMKAMVKRYCDLATDYLPTLCQVQQLISAWRTYRNRYDCTSPDRGGAMTEAWRPVEQFIKGKLYPGIAPTPLDDRAQSELRALADGFLSDLETLVDQLPDDIYREV